MAGGKTHSQSHGQSPYLLGNTLVIPPSVAANTARKPYLKVRMETGEHSGLALGFELLTLPPLVSANCAHVFKSLFFHTLSTSCLMMPVSRIRLWRSRLSPGHIITDRRLADVRAYTLKEGNDIKKYTFNLLNSFFIDRKDELKQRRHKRQQDDKNSKYKIVFCTGQNIQILSKKSEIKNNEKQMGHLKVQTH